MNVMYVTRSAKNHNDVINLHFWMFWINKNTRSYYGHTRNVTLIRNADKCEHCGLDCQQVHMEAHHIKPVWVFALETILRPFPQSREQIHLIVEALYADGSALWELNSPGNLKPLCKSCHNEIHKAEDKKWKQYFEANYPVVFGMRRYKEVEELMRRHATNQLEAR